MENSFYIKTFGCQMNERDAEIMAQLLVQHGYQPSAEPETAGLILVNTCSIRDKAEQKVYSLLGQLRPGKEKNPAQLIGVCGCVAQQEGRRLIERAPYVDLLVGTQQLHELPALLARLHAGERHIAALELRPDFVIPPFQRLLSEPACQKIGHPLRRFVNIMQGCNNFCSYCVVPYTRGREISRPVEDIVAEVKTLVAQGVKEITLLGQNVNSYGKTNPVAGEPVDFAALLRKIAAIPGLLRLRFTTSHPKDLEEGLMRCFAELENLCPHIHLPVQSGADAVLKRMNRGYAAQEYLRRVDKLRSLRPDIALSTDLIVGFPGESEDDFAKTLNLVRTVRYHSAFSFKYSDRPQARAAAFPEKISEETKAGRLARLQALQDEITLSWNESLAGKRVEILVEESTEAGGHGRSTANQIVHFTRQAGQKTPAPGELARVFIKHAGPHSLRGTLA